MDLTFLRTAQRAAQSSWPVVSIEMALVEVSFGNSMLLCVNNDFCINRSEEVLFRNPTKERTYKSKYPLKELRLVKVSRDGKDRLVIAVE